MIKKINQLFNKVTNGDIIAGDKVTFNNIENMNLVNDNRASRKYVEETCILILNNFSKRISIHRQAFEEIIKLRNSGDLWWPDETDFVFAVLCSEGEKLDNEIEDAIQIIKSISPRLFYMCKEYIKFEKEKRSAMQAYMLIPDNVLLRDKNVTFDGRYEKIITDLKDNWDYFKEEMTKLCDNLS